MWFSRQLKSAERKFLEHHLVKQEKIRINIFRMVFFLSHVDCTVKYQTVQLEPNRIIVIGVNFCLIRNGKNRL